MKQRTHANEGRPHLDVPSSLKEQMVDAARNLRGRETPTEALLWNAVRNRRLDGLKFRRQQPFGPFVVDFFCPSHRLVVEIDGSVHDNPTQAESDRSRQEVLESLDLHVLRIDASLVETNLAEALQTIRISVSTLPSQAPLSPSGRGAGGEGLRR